MNTFHRLQYPALPWGDYGHLLNHGMADHLGPDENQIVRLKRTGPYVPAIAFPGIARIVVTDAFRKALESAPFGGLSFRPVIKARIVPSDWHLWEKTAPKPKRYPRGGEPENFILCGKHSPELAEQIGDLWELLVPKGAESKRVEGDKPWIVTRFLLPNTWMGFNLFRSSPSAIYATESGKDWFEQHAPGLVRFEPAETTSG